MCVHGIKCGEIVPRTRYKTIIRYCCGWKDRNKYKRKLLKH